MQQQPGASAEQWPRGEFGCALRDNQTGTPIETLVACQGYNLIAIPAGWANVPVIYPAGGGYQYTPPDTNSETSPSPYFIAPYASGTITVSYIPQNPAYDSYIIFLVRFGLLGSSFGFPADPLYSLPELDSLRASLSTSSPYYRAARSACPPTFSLTPIVSGPDGTTWSCIKQ